MTVDKAVALVVRGGAGRREVLVLDHPLAGTQLPKGTREAGESLEAAALRELAEEAGLELAGPARPIGMWERRLEPAGSPAATHLWHLFVIDAAGSEPESWTHRATGSAAEEGLLFAFRWTAIDAALADALDPLYAAAARLLLAYEEARA